MMGQKCMQLLHGVKEMERQTIFSLYHKAEHDGVIQ